MKRLKVAVLIKNTLSAFNRDTRGMGMWSYPVEQFEWDFIAPGKSFMLDTKALKRQGYDFIFHEDGGAWGDYNGHYIPSVYYAIDSTLSHENHYLPRLAQAQKADLVMVDHDKLERFEIRGKKPPVRLGYCVNDKVFHPSVLPRRDHIAFHCGGDAAGERAKVRKVLHDICQQNPWYYHSGTLPLGEYADSMARHKIVVNMPRNPQNRPHRVLDAMACQSCLLSMPFPTVEGEWFFSWQHYLVFLTPAELEEKIRILLTEDKWAKIAIAGYDVVMKHHTWFKRAGHLRKIINQEFGL